MVKAAAMMDEKSRERMRVVELSDRVFDGLEKSLDFRSMDGSLERVSQPVGSFLSSNQEWISECVQWDRQGDGYLFGAKVVIGGSPEVTVRMRLCKGDGEMWALFEDPPGDASVTLSLEHPAAKEIERFCEDITKSIQAQLRKA